MELTVKMIVLRDSMEDSVESSVPVIHVIKSTDVKMSQEDTRLV